MIQLATWKLSSLLCFARHRRKMCSGWTTYLFSFSFLGLSYWASSLRTCCANTDTKSMAFLWPNTNGIPPLLLGISNMTGGGMACIDEVRK